MHDTVAAEPDHSRLFGIASGQQGHFTAGQARVCGFGWDDLSYHVRRGRFIRVHRGVYRFRDYPSGPREDVMAAWLAVGKDVAVVSHEIALDLLDLSDVIPNAVDLTVPRSRRYLAAPPGARLHTTTRPPRPADVTEREGIRLTSATRTILDAAEYGTAGEQVEMAVVQASERGQTTRALLEAGARERNHYVAELVAGALELVGRSTPGLSPWG